MAKFIATAPLFIGRARAANPGDEVPEDSIEKHRWTDSVEKVDDEAKPATVKEILAEVGDDPAKAAAALETEQARGDDARPTLVDKLEAIVTNPTA